MATQREQSGPEPLEGETLVRAIMADKKLVAEAIEAQRRIEAGEANWVLVRGSEIRDWVNGKRRKRPI